MRNSNYKWVFPTLIDVPVDFETEIGGFSIVAQTLFRRGLTSIPKAKAHLDPDFYIPTSPTDLPDVEIAAHRIIKAINNQERILIWGDFDVDGQTSTSLLSSALTELGAAVFHYIPNRANESHGINLDTLAQLIKKLDPNLIITCDTGIDAVQQVDFAAGKNVDVIITDHHQLPNSLPNALAIINPAFLDIDHPLFHLPGVGVVYKLIEHLFSLQERDPSKYLDLVALGIVADVAVVDDDTRYLLQLGLEHLRKPQRLGLITLYQKIGIDPEDVTEEEIGFLIAPRLNALGRLSDANSCVDFFTSSDQMLVNELVDRLDSLNTQRQILTDQIFQESLEQLEAHPDIDQDYPVIVLLGPPSWNPGVIGIVASRLVDRFQKPVIMLTEDGDIARGSARSIPGVGISDLISKSSDILHKHGGHPMAAGLTLSLDKVPQLRRGLAKYFHQIYGETAPTIEVIIDAELPFQSLSPDLISDIKRLSPFGPGNPKLLFAAREVSLLKDQMIGKTAKHRKLKISDSSGFVHDFLWWNSVGIDLPKKFFDIAYSLDINTYRNQQQVQATLQYFRTSEKDPVYLSKPQEIKFIDHRQSAEPEEDIADILQKDPSTIIWAEYNRPDNFAGLPRGSLRKTNTLIVWTIPPSRKVLKSIVELTAPGKIHVFANDPGFFSKNELLEALAGMLKHIKSTGKKYDPVLFAQRLALPPAVIECGLDWLHCHGDLDLTDFKSTNKFKKGSGQTLECFPEVDIKLSQMVIEVRSFRNFFKTATLHTIL